MQGDYSRWTFDPRRDYRSVLLQQGRVLLDADVNEQGAITAWHDEIRTRDLLGRAGGPANDSGFGIVDVNGAPPAGTAWADLRITPGRYYVDGVLAAARLAEGATDLGLSLADQPYLAAIAGAPGLPEPAPGRYALYLDVWTHHVTVDEDPTLREVALGGPDTSARARTVWQVRATPLTPDEHCSDLHAAGWLTPTPGTMTPGLVPAEPGADPCQISTSGGYSRLENQLYRVEIRVDGGPPQFVWSRENASVVSGLVGIGPTVLPGMDATLTLDRVGPDDELSIQEGDVVEVTSTDLQLRGTPGFLATAGAPDGLDLPVHWSNTAGPSTIAELGHAPIVRRWEGAPRPADGTVADLENGITVSFGAGELRTGDFWLIPARAVRLLYGLSTQAGTLDWPTDNAGAPVPKTPLGPVHAVTPLAIVVGDVTGWTRESDCRIVVPSLDDLVAIDLVGGDGQEAPPGTELPQPIRLAVRNGGLPVAGARVQITPSGGTITDGTLTGATIVTSTGPDGVAAVRWTLDPAGAVTQTLVAQRLDDHDQGIDVQIVVTGRLATASGRPPGLHVVKAVVNLPAPPQFTNDVNLKVEEVAAGFQVELDGPFDPRSVVVGDRTKPVVRVVLDLPWPLPGEGGTVWPDLRPIGFRATELDAVISADGGAGVITWTPADLTRQWLLTQFRHGITQINWVKPITGRFVIDGWAVVGKDPSLHLNGHARSEVDANGITQLLLPTDDDVTGGQFVQWFGVV